jgi:hypothetical protein
MNRKILLTVLVLTAIMLATPYVGMAYAGKGEEKQYFKLYVVGRTNSATGEIWFTPDPVTGPMKHGRNVEWLSSKVLQVTIGSKTYSTPDISYSCVIDADYNIVTLVGHQRVRETVTFYCFAEPATLEILAIGDLGQAGVVFTGHGTGALEGVKVKGTTWAVVLPPLAVTREGTIMGWPS